MMLLWPFKILILFLSSLLKWKPYGGKLIFMVRFYSLLWLCGYSICILFKLYIDCLLQSLPMNYFIAENPTMTEWEILIVYVMQPFWSWRASSLQEPKKKCIYICNSITQNGYVLFDSSHKKDNYHRDVGFYEKTFSFHKEGHSNINITENMPLNDSDITHSDVPTFYDSPNILEPHSYDDITYALSNHLHDNSDGLGEFYMNGHGNKNSNACMNEWVNEWMKECMNEIWLRCFDA